MAKWRVKNASGSTYELQTETDTISQMPFEIDPWTPRLDVSERYGRSGVNISGDEKISKRRMKFVWEKAFNSDTEWFTFANDITDFLNPKRGPFYLEDTDNDKRALCRLSNFTSKPNGKGLEYRFMSGTLEFYLLDATFEDLQATTNQQTGLVTESTFDINNAGNEDSFPVITVTTIDDLSTFTLTNTTNNSNMTVANSSMTTGKTIEIDCQNGTVKLNTVDISTSISSGGFLVLSPGVNTIEYTSPDGDVDIDTVYRARYAY